MQVRRFLESKLSDLFVRWGYEQIAVPLVERASSFSEQVVGASPWPEWDRRGVIYLQIPGYAQSYSDLPEQVPALLVPEGTISVSRWIAKQHSLGTTPYPRKIFYVLPCFRNELLSKLSTFKHRQFHRLA